MTFYALSYMVMLQLLLLSCLLSVQSGIVSISRLVHSSESEAVQQRVRIRLLEYGRGRLMHMTARLHLMRHLCKDRRDRQVGNDEGVLASKQLERIHLARGGGSCRGEEELPISD